MEAPSRTNQPHYFKWTFFIILILFISSVVLSGCGSTISQSTVKLSANVGNRLSEMEHIHQLAIQRYFDMEHEKIENFLTETWEPLFLKNFLGTSRVLEKIQNVSLIDATSRSQLQDAFELYLADASESEKATDDLIEKLNVSRRAEDNLVRDVVSLYIEDNRIDAAVIHINSLLGTDEPARIIFDFAEAAHIEMNARRKSLFAPLRQARSETVAELSAVYAELIRGQSTITGRLEAAANISEEQDKLLEAFGINTTTKKLQEKLSNFSKKIDNALDVVNGLSATGNNTTSSNTILKTLQEELRKINGLDQTDSSK